jgi:hypothetical protein
MLMAELAVTLQEVPAAGARPRRGPAHTHMSTDAMSEQTSSQAAREDSDNDPFGFMNKVQTKLGNSDTTDLSPGKHRPAGHHTGLRVAEVEYTNPRTGAPDSTNHTSSKH